MVILTLGNSVMGEIHYSMKFLLIDKVHSLKNFSTYMKIVKFRKDYK